MLISISCVTWGKNQWTSVYSLVILYYLMFYAESPKLCLQRKLDKRPNRVADESGHEFYANSQVWILHYFRWTSVLLSYLNDYRVQDYYYFFFFCLFDILINSQADIKTHETSCLCFKNRYLPFTQHYNNLVIASPLRPLVGFFHNSPEMFL